MTKMIFASSLIALFTSPAMADFQLSQNKKSVKCYGEENVTVDLNKKRTTLQYTVEGESLGPQKITAVETDNKTYITYKTASAVTLTLSNAGDTYIYSGDQETSPIECH